MLCRADSNELICGTSGWIFFSSRSFLLPKIFFKARLSTLACGYNGLRGRLATDLRTRLPHHISHHFQPKEQPFHRHPFVMAVKEFRKTKVGLQKKRREAVAFDSQMTVVGGIGETGNQAGNGNSPGVVLDQTP